MNWFRERIINNIPWFRYDQPSGRLEGWKKGNQLLLRAKAPDNREISVVLDPESVDRFIRWLNRSYPEGGRGNVVPIRMAPKLSISRPSGNAGADSPDPRG